MHISFARKLREDGLRDISIMRLAGSAFLLMFKDKESLDKTKSEYEEFLQRWFKKLSLWSEDVVSCNRQTWIACQGIPVHAWNEETFNNIASIWGELISVDENTIKPYSFSRANIQILTNNGELSLISMESSPYDFPSGMQEPRRRVDCGSLRDEEDICGMGFGMQETWAKKVNRANSASILFLDMQDLYSKSTRKYGSLLELQDKALSLKEKKRRDHAIKRNKRLGKEKTSLEASPTNSDIVRKQILTRSARNVFTLEKRCGIEFIGDENEILEDFAAAEMQEKYCIF
ncbi:hypothetical protein V6N13_049530 [Hibiscus sabdariffa]|uniref:DUF4283 domain-containing protein n=1 Tax=Hibiscus sabdariffa TaxID=183260 RepID=A0ABR2QXC1_9ROSI